MLDVIGHSMEPMIRHKDTILVDQSVKELRDGDIFLVGFGEELLVKRVQRTPRGWLLKSENRDFSDIVVEGPDLRNLPCLRAGTLVRAGRLRAAPPAEKHPPPTYPGSPEEFLLSPLQPPHIYTYPGMRPAHGSPEARAASPHSLPVRARLG